jgi:hypothetical protein
LGSRSFILLQQTLRCPPCCWCLASPFDFTYPDYLHRCVDPNLVTFSHLIPGISLALIRVTHHPCLVATCVRSSRMHSFARPWFQRLDSPCIGLLRRMVLHPAHASPASFSPRASVTRCSLIRPIPCTWIILSPMRDARSHAFLLVFLHCFLRPSIPTRNRKPGWGRDLGRWLGDKRGGSHR